MTKVKTPVEAKGTPVKVKPVVDINKLIETEAGILKEMQLTEKAGESVQKRYQRIALSVIVHLHKHQDIRLVRRMVEKFPEGLNINSMKRFLETYGQIRILQEGDLLKPAYKDMEVNTIVFDKTKKLRLGEAVEKPWWKAMKQPEYKPLDIDAMIQNVIRLADARMKKGISKEKGDNIDPAKVEALRKLVKQA